MILNFQSATDQRILIALHSDISRVASRLWFRWRVGLEDTLKSTSIYLEDTTELDSELIEQWRDVLAGRKYEWAQMVNSTNPLVDIADMEAQREEDDLIISEDHELDVDQE